MNTMTSDIGGKRVGAKIHLDTEVLTEMRGENEKIPTVLYIEEVGLWLKEKDVPVETAIGAYNQLYAKVRPSGGVILLLFVYHFRPDSVPLSVDFSFLLSLKCSSPALKPQKPL